MAYINQETKKQLSPAIKAVLKKHGFTGSVGVLDRMKLCINIKSGPIAVNEIYRDGKRNSGYASAYLSNGLNESTYTAKAFEFLTELDAACKTSDYRSKSDAMTDYFDISYYIEARFGNFEKHYTKI